MIGRMPRHNSFIKQLEAAALICEEKYGMSLAMRAMQMAFTDKTVMIAVLKKFAPDLAQVKVGQDGQVSVTFELKDFRKVENTEEKSPRD